MKKRRNFILIVIFCLMGVLFPKITLQAKITAEQKKEYKNAVSRAIRDGVDQKNMDVYAKISRTLVGKNLMKKAAIENRAALMAEGIDFLDSNWSHYYAVVESEGHTVFQSTKNIGRKSYAKRYKKIMKGLQEVLSCIEPGMSDADKAMAVYYYLAKNTEYKKSRDCHTGYDVLVKHTGVCDGLANAYALAMNTLGIPCAVVSSYSKDHSWNIVRIGKTWYLCDLTNGSGTGEHEGMVVSFSGCLVGVPTFLKTHTGYSKWDIYGEGNSDDLEIHTLKLASYDYIPSRSSIRMSLESKPCLFYEKGYWYWISAGNMLMRSKLTGQKEAMVYYPSDDVYIGWAEEYDGRIYISLNDKIYLMSYDGKLGKLVRKVAPTEYVYEMTSYFWSLAYVGRFHKNADGGLGYYVTDLRGTKKGRGSIKVTGKSGLYNKRQLSEKNITLRAGYFRQLYPLMCSPRDMKTIRWTSTKPSVASVDANGLVQAKKKGTAVITAVINKKKIKCKVKVTGYTIAYKRSGINSEQNVETASGKKSITLKEPKREGYVFTGWYLDKKETEKITVIKKGNTKKIVLYAGWEKEKK